MDLISVNHREDNVFTTSVRGHTVDADLGKSDGGNDRAMSPSEMLVGALGSCIGIMVRKYCEQHEYRDGEVSVSMTYELADNPKRIGSIIVDLEIPKDVPAEKKSAIRRITELCPIHGTLQAGTKIDIEIL